MSPASNVTLLPNFREFINTNILPCVASRHRNLFDLGINAFTLKPIVSCNANARMVYRGSGGDNRNNVRNVHSSSNLRKSAEQTMYRLLRNEAIPQSIWTGLAEMNLLGPKDIINVDYSTCGSLAVLAFARQTKRGRAAPILFKTLASNTGGQKKSHPDYFRQKELYESWKQEAGTDQYGFVIEGIEELQRLYGDHLKFVFDRGFGYRRIIDYLLNSKHGHIFYIRFRDDFVVATIDSRQKKQKVEDLPHGDWTVTWRGVSLRLVIGGDKNNPWRIITNDYSTGCKRIRRIYYYRFEIEECFRDIKSLLRLRATKLKTWRSLNAILAFMAIAFAFVYQIGAGIGTGTGTGTGTGAGTEVRARARDREDRGTAGTRGSRKGGSIEAYLEQTRRRDRYLRPLSGMRSFLEQIEREIRAGGWGVGGSVGGLGLNLVARLNPARWEATGFPLQGGTLQGLPLQRGGLRGGCGACILMS